MIWNHIWDAYSNIQVNQVISVKKGIIAVLWNTDFHCNNMYKQQVEIHPLYGFPATSFLDALSQLVHIQEQATIVWYVTSPLVLCEPFFEKYNYSKISIHNKMVPPGKDNNRVKTIVYMNSILSNAWYNAVSVAPFLFSCFGWERAGALGMKL